MSNIIRPPTILGSMPSLMPRSYANFSPRLCTPDSPRHRRHRSRQGSARWQPGRTSPNRSAESRRHEESQPPSARRQRERLFRDPLQRVPRPLGDLLDVDLNVVPVKHHPVFLVIRNPSRRTLRLAQLLEAAMKLVGSRLETVPRVHNRLNTARKFGNRSRAVNRLRRGRLREQCIHTKNGARENQATYWRGSFSRSPPKCAWNMFAQICHLHASRRSMNRYWANLPFLRQL